MNILLPYEDEIDLPFLRAYISAFKDVLKMARKLLNDKSKSLELRWEMYLLIQPFLETDGSYMSFHSLGEVSWYDDFYLEKGETMQLDKDFIELAEEQRDLDEDQVNSLKEEILDEASKHGYGSFENDW
jgi:hypothetical protein